MSDPPSPRLPKHEHVANEDMEKANRVTGCCAINGIARVDGNAARVAGASTRQCE